MIWITEKLALCDRSSTGGKEKNYTTEWLLQVELNIEIPQLKLQLLYTGSNAIFRNMPFFQYHYEVKVSSYADLMIFFFLHFFVICYLRNVFCDMTFSICETPGLVYQYLHVEYYVVICTVFHSIKDVFCLISSFSLFIYFLNWNMKSTKPQLTI